MDLGDAVAGHRQREQRGQFPVDEGQQARHSPGRDGHQAGALTPEAYEVVRDPFGAVDDEPGEQVDASGDVRIEHVDELVEIAVGTRGDEAIGDQSVLVRWHGPAAAV